MHTSGHIPTGTCTACRRGCGHRMHSVAVQTADKGSGAQQCGGPGPNVLRRLTGLLRHPHSQVIPSSFLTPVESGDHTCVVPRADRCTAWKHTCQLEHGIHFMPCMLLALYLVAIASCCIGADLCHGLPMPRAGRLQERRSSVSALAPTSTCRTTAALALLAPRQTSKPSAGTHAVHGTCPGCASLHSNAESELGADRRVQ